jgi:flagellar biosynthetic protein FliR
VAGIFTFVPVPGLRNSQEIARAFLALMFTLALFPCWPAVQTRNLDGGIFLMWLMAEAATGLAAGLAVGFVCDGLIFCMQMAGMQAGFSYASTIDPTTQADSTVLLVAGQLIGGLLFFATGFDRNVIRILAGSLESIPSMPDAAGATSITRLGAGLFLTGFRLAAPVVALLLLLDIALALASRVNAQLQMLSVAFPLKMLAGLAALALTLRAWPLLFSAQQKLAVAAISRYVAH